MPQQSWASAELGLGVVDSVSALQRSPSDQHGSSRSQALQELLGQEVWWR